MCKFRDFNLFFILSVLANTAYASVPSTGSVAYGPTTAVPSLTGNMLIVLSLLLLVVAFKMTRQKNSNKLFVTLVSTAALLSATGGFKVISDVDAGGDVIFLSNPSGDIVTFAEGGSFTFTNNSGVVQQIKIITEPPTEGGCPNLPSAGGERPVTNECSPGMILNNGQVCNIDCTSISEVSDKRLKREIKALKTLKNGITLYSFKYQWSDETYVGVMAQDLLSIPAYIKSVTLLESGFYAVNYKSLGLQMLTYDQWKKPL